MENRSSGPLEIVEQQNAIIRIQSGVIDELFLLLMQHISAEEADGSLPLRECGLKFVYVAYACGELRHSPCGSVD